MTISGQLQPGTANPNPELQKQLKQRDTQVELLTQQVAQLMQTTQELQACAR